MPLHTGPAMRIPGRIANRRHVMDIERMEPDGWDRVRAIRLRALREAPDAFGSTLEREEDREPEFWRERLANPDAATFIAMSGDEDVGVVMGADFRGRPAAAGLFAMWVAPEARGRGAAGPLVEAVIAWARSSGYERVLLEVGDTNTAAIRLYEKKGFAPTGARGSLPAPRTHIREHERALVL